MHSELRPVAPIYTYASVSLSNVAATTCQWVAPGGRATGLGPHCLAVEPPNIRAHAGSCTSGLSKAYALPPPQALCLSLAHTDTHTRAHMHAHTDTYTRVHMHTHTCKEHTHTHTHTHKHRRPQRYEALKHVSFAVQTLGKCAKVRWG
jgi:hypothetical protein